MSYYYNYYIGYQTADNKLYPLGIYDSFNHLRSVISASRSFASDLHEMFNHVEGQQVTSELRKEFEYEDWDGKKCVNLKYLLLDELPKESFIKHGYFLIDDVKTYERTHDTWDLFYERLSPEIYAAMLQNELTLGVPKPKKDCEGEELETYSASEYMYYAYPDYQSREYDAHILRTVAESLYSYRNFQNGEKLVILETEG